MIELTDRNNGKYYVSPDKVITVLKFCRSHLSLINYTGQDSTFDRIETILFCDGDLCVTCTESVEHVRWLIEKDLDKQSKDLTQ